MSAINDCAFLQYKTITYYTEVVNVRGRMVLPFRACKHYVFLMYNAYESQGSHFQSQNGMNESQLDSLEKVGAFQVHKYSVDTGYENGYIWYTCVL